MKAAALAVSACLALLAAPVNASASWSEAERVIGPEENIFSLVASTAADGTRNVAWTNYEYAAYRNNVIFTRRTPGDTLIAPVVVNHAGQAYEPVVATTPDDTTYLTWRSETGVYLDVIEPDDEVIEVGRLPIEGASESAVVVGPNETATIVLAGESLAYMRVTPEGAIEGEREIHEAVSGYSYTSPVASSYSEGVVVAWNSRHEGLQELEASRIPYSTGVAQAPFPVSSSAFEDIWNLRLATNASGAALLSWEAQVNEETPFSVYAARVAAGASTTDGQQELDIPGAPPRGDTAPYLYADGSGGVAELAEAEGAETGLMLVPFTAGGRAELAEAQQVGGPASSVRGLAAQTSPDGEVTLLWLADGTLTTSSFDEIAAPSPPEALEVGEAQESLGSSINAEGELVAATTTQVNAPVWVRTGFAPAPPQECEAGSFSATGYEPCTAAAPGHYVPGNGATAELPCPAGTYSETSGASACQVSPPDTYAPEGATHPTACPPGSESAAGSSACSASHDAAGSEAGKGELGPVVSDASLDHRCVAPFALRVGGSPRKSKLVLTYTLDESAIVTYTLSRRKGSPAWRSCPSGHGRTPGHYEMVWSGSEPGARGSQTVGVAQTSRSRRGAKLAAGSHAIALAAAISASGVAGQRLRPGTYILTIAAANAHGSQSTAAHVKFWVVKAAHHPNGR